MLSWLNARGCALCAFAPGLVDDDIQWSQVVGYESTLETKNHTNYS